MSKGFDKLPQTQLDPHKAARAVLGQAVLDVELVLAKLLNDPEVTKMPTFWATREGINRLMEGKMWLTSQITPADIPHVSNGLSKLSPKTGSK